MIDLIETGTKDYCNAVRKIRTGPAAGSQRAEYTTQAGGHRRFKIPGIRHRIHSTKYVDHGVRLSGDFIDFLVNLEQHIFATRRFEPRTKSCQSGVQVFAERARPEDHDLIGRCAEALA